MAFDEASALAVRTQWGNMVTCASITLLPQNRNINYPTKLIVIYSNICCAVDWSGVISPKALWQKKLYFGSNFRPCCSADGSLRERFEVMMVLLCGSSVCSGSCNHGAVCERVCHSCLCVCSHMIFLGAGCSKKCRVVHARGCAVS